MKATIAILVAASMLVACVTVKPPITVNRGPGWYTVKKSDTLYSIAWRYGLDYKELARWNRIDVNAPIHPGQRLRLLKPDKSTQIASTTIRLISLNVVCPAPPVGPARRRSQRPCRTVTA